MGAKRRYRIGITGSYGGMNLGDEAILESIVAGLRRSVDAELTVFTRDARDTRARHAVDRVVAARQAARGELQPLVEALDLLIFGGGGILFDGEARPFLREVQLAHAAGVPVAVFGIGAGPLAEAANQELVRDCLSPAAVLTVRDRDAQRLLEEIGVSRAVEVTADPAFLLRPEPFPRAALAAEGIRGRRALVGMSVREPGGAAPELRVDEYHRILADTADFMVERFDAELLFIPMERIVQDLQHAHAVVSRMRRPQQARVLHGVYRPGQILGLMRHLEFAVGMRLHFLVFAAMQRVPFVALPYAGKVHGLLERFGMTMPPMHLVTAGPLIAHIDRLWDRRQSLRAQIQARLPEARRGARRNHELTLAALRAGARREG